MSASLAAPPPRPRFQPADPGFAARMQASFARQKAMALIGATLARVAPGYAEVALPFRDDLTQQKGYVHGGIVARADVHAEDGRHIATMQQTLMMLPDTPDIPE
jgi:acyl-coenzyme A thioesterase PaaI-like protein